MESIDVLSGEVRVARFLTSYRRYSGRVSEVLEAGTITEMAYVPPEVQIRDMMSAGERLAAERRARFDSRELGLKEGDDVPLDVTREPGVDLVDVGRAAERLRRRRDEKRQAVAAKRVAGAEPVTKEGPAAAAAGSAEPSAVKG